MWGHTQVSLLLVALVVLATVTSTPAQIIFPETPSDSLCTAHTGDPGHCINIKECPLIHGIYHNTTPVLCGFNGRFPIVCCPHSNGGNTAPIVDISPPAVSFQCGTNPRKSFNLLISSPDEEFILRPDATSSDVAASFIPNRPEGSGIPSRPMGSGIPSRPEESGIPSHADGSFFPKQPEGPRPGIPESAFKDPAAHVARDPPPPPRRPKAAFNVESLAKETFQPSPGGILEDLGDTVPIILQAVGGIIAEKNAWPWMALIGDNDKQGFVTWFCAGALINEQWVLTASHCFLFRAAQVVRLGEHDYNDNGDGAAHEDFKPFINPVCLPWGQESINDQTGKKVTLTGWGDTQFGGKPSSVLQEVEVTIFPFSDCDKSYSTLLGYTRQWPRGIGKETVCAGDRAGGRDACQGDSGGPLVLRNSAGQYTMAGVVSRGYGCGHKDFPGLYANIHEEQYLAWVKKVAF
ncbi:Clotting factor B-like 4 [Homarus americanus]|uniref:CLIP domain-containing serine protease n=1 Tax=Homarus americanus TaxID=6706 RepID=A0A8J5N0T8_HOMAM|nr:Clotting factor B-like 4 [Homarus americanus]